MVLDKRVKSHIFSFCQPNLFPVNSLATNSELDLFAVGLSSGCIHLWTLSEPQTLVRVNFPNPLCIKINFFGKPASTTTIPAQLIKKYKCDLVPIYIERRKNNYFKMFVSEPIKIGNNKSIKEITEHLNKILEKMILKNLDQWIWTHDRWKT